MIKMMTNGLSVLAADGLHSDGWCWPQTRLSLKALRDSPELRVGVWLKPEPGQTSRALFTICADNAPPKAEFIEFDQPAELTLAMNVRAGDELSVSISTPHRASRGDDARDLSFVMSSLSLL
jgi:hypothetical protein